MAQNHRRMAMGGEHINRAGLIFRGDHSHHAHATVKGFQHFALRNIACALQPAHHRWQGYGGQINLRPQAFGQYTRQVFG